MDKTNIGIDLGGTKLLIVCGSELHRIETGPDFSPALMDTEIRKFLSDRNIAPQSIGIAVPALVDRAGRIGTCDVLPKMTRWDPAETLADLRCNVTVINDAKAALAEEMHDAKKNITAGVVMVGTAIGAAFLTEGEKLLGQTGLAGELGYLPLVFNGKTKRLDELAGGAFLASKCNTNGKNLAERAKNGDAAVLSSILEGGYFLGIGLASVINLLNPARLALGGGTISLPGYLDAAIKSAEEHTIPELWQACTISTVRAGDAVAALGALRVAQVL